MSSPTPPSGEFSPDDVLPPVEPPTAGFILQLFIVPGLIVAVVVMIWVLFNWLAQMGNDRDAYVRALSRNNEARWQAAFNLANALRAERNAKNPRLTVDSQLAAQLAEILDKEIEAGSLDKNAISLRYYLCRALGDFRVSDALPTLIKAASTERGEAEADVRRAAIEGIAFAATNSDEGLAPFQENLNLRAALIDASSDTEPRTRSVAAVTMGVIGGDAFRARLARMLDDAHPNVRYNAATRLAALGDAAAVPVLVEMLNPNEQAGVEIEPDEKLRPLKRTMNERSALAAAEVLAKTNPSDDLDPLIRAVQSLSDLDQLDAETRTNAKNALRELQSRGAVRTP